MQISLGLSNQPINNKQTKSVRPLHQQPLLRNLPYDTVSFQAKAPTKKVVKEGQGFLERMVDKITKNPTGLSEEESASIQKRLEETEAQMAKLERERLLLGRVRDYDRLKKEGISSRKIRRFVREDNEMLNRSERFVVQVKKDKRYMFGYPANMEENSAMTQHLRREEATLPLMNNCGDNVDKGYYHMDSKEFEIDLIKKVQRNVGYDSKSWGYIASGGSEGNEWGIKNGLKTFPNGRVYYSQATHYSADKVVSVGPNVNGEYVETIKHTKIDTLPNSEKIDPKKLVEEAKKNWEENQEPAIILLTAGTTQTGARDNVTKIARDLDKAGVPHYIHLDAALNGGIGRNQKGAPKLPNLDRVGVDSASVSMHKYFGNNEVKSVVMSRVHPNGKRIEYLNGVDNTTSGSRSVNPMSGLQVVTETLERKPSTSYSRNINKFERYLREAGVEFKREPKANTFVVDKPSEELCEKYQLAPIKAKGEDGRAKAHILIFPHHEPEIMKELAQDLAKDKLNK